MSTSSRLSAWPRSGVAALGALALAWGALLAIAPPPSAAAATGTGTGADVPVDASGQTLGGITGVSQKDAAVTLTAARGAVRISFLDETSVRIEADPSGTFSDPANTPQKDPSDPTKSDAARSADIVVGADSFQAPQVSVEQGSVIRVSTSKVTVTVDRSTSQLSMLRADGTAVWTESSPLSFGASTTQHLKPQQGEQFIGGGMQNGRVVHTGQTINITKDYNWADGGHPNAVPYYMSSAGYGVLRDTFAPGSYTFTGDTTTTHAEKRFDAYYFVGDYKQALNSYTQLTGRPMMPPIYALEYGDADCYNRSNPGYSSSGFTSADTPKQKTYDAVQTAKAFADNDMPAGWMLVNDGYGCEYTPDPSPYDPSNPGKGLGGTVQGIKDAAGLKTGLWTQRSLTQQESEVGQDGIALRKLDVAWVGEGYRMALTACENAHDGIEQYSSARGTVLMVEGWAGAQRCGMQWTGDHTGSLDAIRWEVPAISGSANSGLAFTTADVDGIFGGSPESYVRDLQWKALAPALYSMSGWAPVDKRPWLYGDAATQINRQYLQLRQRLMPYIYSLSADAHRDGVSPVRSMPLEFPADPASYSAEATNQFMLGGDILVAPVSSHTDIRNGIQLPAGSSWIDYWTGKSYQGGQVVNGYAAPLQTLPMFIRAGAVVPQGIVARNASLVPEDSTITLDVYPSGRSTFTLTEDDKVSRDYASGAASVQTFTVDAPAKDAGDVAVTIGTRTGSYTGMAASRPYQLDVHSGSAPDAVRVGGTELPKQADKAAFDAAPSGWYYDQDAPGGVVHVKAGPVASTDSQTVTLVNTSAVGGKASDASAAEVSVALDDQAFQGQGTTERVTFRNTGDHAKTAVTLAPKLADGWTVTGTGSTTVDTVAPGASATAEFTIVPGTANAGLQTVGATATYTDAQSGSHTISGANQIDVAFGSLAGAYDSVSVTTVAGRASGDFDGGGASFSAEQLKTAPTPQGGVSPGSTVTVDAGTPTKIDYTWPKAGPDVPDSVSMNGQTIGLTGTGTHLAVLASAAAGQGVTPELTLSYADGTVQKQSLFFPNWLPQGSLGGATVAISSLGRNNAANANSPEYTTSTYQVYSNTVRLIPGKQLKAVTLPVATNVKVFDWQVADFPLPAAPTGDVFASDLDWVSATTGWGTVGKDVANVEPGAATGDPLSINGTTYTKGLGVHASSKITYYLGGQCTRFTADVGLQDPFTGKIIFSVVGDGTQRYQSRTYVPGFAAEHVDVDVTGVQYIELNVDPTTAGAINGAHGDWANAAFRCAPPDTTAPTTTATVTPDAAASGWYTTAPSVALAATDDVGVTATQYRWTPEGAWNLYDKPVLLSDGVTSFGYRSLDAAGNTEDAKTVTLKVDTVAPTVSIAADRGARTVTVTGSDATSGIDRIEYSIDGGATWSTYGAALSAPEGGISVLARAFDKAGNVSSTSAPAVIPPVDQPQPGQPLIDAPRTAQAGSRVDIHLRDFPASASLTVTLHSTPVQLGAVVADGDGAADLAATIPADTEPGTHTIVVTSGDEVLASSALTVVAAGAPVGPAAGPSTAVSALPTTGADPAPLLGIVAALLAIGGALVALRRRRRSADRPQPDEA
ncbi:NPCBM/NEW2 domain-containing protein [uncultured Microbacterium sp.]|uniref:NPCBM/NEW2 domain-containing protein n=1 Tax=uncultured Microbacterium sp. TaxID=191216 RepID=UPI0025EE3B68|nr:NPCBM/NEW2 domain-containing protein [uncultured Microbacterium sp.]